MHWDHLAIGQVHLSQEDAKIREPIGRRSVEETVSTGTTGQDSPEEGGTDESAKTKQMSADFRVECFSTAWRPKR
jgi:hypothetical protein